MHKNVYPAVIQHDCLTCNTIYAKSGVYAINLTVKMMVLYWLFFPIYLTIDINGQTDSVNSNYMHIVIGNICQCTASYNHPS